MHGGFGRAKRTVGPSAGEIYPLTNQLSVFRTNRGKIEDGAVATKPHLPLKQCPAHCSQSTLHSVNLPTN